MAIEDELHSEISTLFERLSADSVSSATIVLKNVIDVAVGKLSKMWDCEDIACYLDWEAQRLRKGQNA